MLCEVKVNDYIVCVNYSSYVSLFFRDVVR